MEHDLRCQSLGPLEIKDTYHLKNSGLSELGNIPESLASISLVGWCYWLAWINSNTLKYLDLIKSSYILCLYLGITVDHWEPLY